MMYAMRCAMTPRLQACAGQNQQRSVAGGNCFALWFVELGKKIQVLSFALRCRLVFLCALRVKRCEVSALAGLWLSCGSRDDTFPTLVF